MKEILAHKQIKSVLGILQNQGHLIYWHTPNGEARSIVTASRLKSMGVRAGVWDFAIFSRHFDGVIFAEVKSKKGALSPSQKSFRDEMLKHSKAAFYVWTDAAQALDDLKKIINRA